MHRPNSRRITCSSLRGAACVVGVALLLPHVVLLAGEVPRDVLYISTRDRVVVPDCDLHIAKQAEDMRFEVIREFASGGIQLAYTHREAPIRASVTIYPAPEGTHGPTVVLDASGSPVPDEDRANPYAVSKLTAPAPAFEEEFGRMVQSVQQVTGMRFVNKQGKPARKLARPADVKTSPVAFVAFFERPEEGVEPKSESVDEFQESRLYCYKGFFVKIHVSGPRCQELLSSPTAISAAVWDTQLSEAP